MQPDLIPREPARHRAYLIPDSLHRALEARCRTEGVSMSWMVRRLIERYLQETAQLELIARPRQSPSRRA